MPVFKVMTWNVENLFRPDPGAPQEDRDRYDQKLQLLAQVIDNEAPDVLALQETGGEEPLQDLQQALNNPFPSQGVSFFPDGRGIRVAFLARQAVELTEDIVDFPPGPALDVSGLTATGATPPITRMRRGALRIRVSKDDLTVDVITAHLKSKLLTFPSPEGGPFQPRDEEERAQVGGIALHVRTAEATTLRIRANQFLNGNAESPLILLGDFNDVPAAQTSLLLAGPPGSEIGTLGFNRDDAGDDVRLFNVAPLIAEERRFSRIHRGRGELLDQIFASVELFPRADDGDRTTPVVDSLIDFADELESVGEDPRIRTDEVKPDHSPVVATFTI
jgi:endonuclease/exonuclease/phosphatase family metal-dependent hydrolase